VISKNISLDLRFQLNEQQKLKFVRVSGTNRCCNELACDSTEWYRVLVMVVRMCGTERYGKVWACDSADWYSVLVKVVRVC
jgi:hypothetical protein